MTIRQQNHHSDTPRPRYSSRAQNLKGVKRELGFSADLEKEKARARRYHERYGFKVWVWDIHTGKAVPGSQIERAVAAGGQA